MKNKNNKLFYGIWKPHLDDIAKEHPEIIEGFKKSIKETKDMTFLQFCKHLNSISDNGK